MYGLTHAAIAGGTHGECSVEWLVSEGDDSGVVFFRTTSDLRLVKQNAQKFFCDEAASMVA
jgi:hypothetical protein